MQSPRGSTWYFQSSVYNMCWFFEVLCNKKWIHVLWNVRYTFVAKCDRVLNALVSVISIEWFLRAISSGLFYNHTWQNFVLWLLPSFQFELSSGESLLRPWYMKQIRYVCAKSYVGFTMVLVYVTKVVQV